MESLRQIVPAPVDSTVIVGLEPTIKEHRRIAVLVDACLKRGHDNQSYETREG